MFQRCYGRQLTMQRKSFTLCRQIHLQRTCTSRTLNLRDCSMKNILRYSCRNITPYMKYPTKNHFDKHSKMCGILVCSSNFRDQKYGNWNGEKCVSNIGRLSCVVGGILLGILLQMKSSLKADKPQYEIPGSQPDRNDSENAEARNLEDSISLEEAISNCRTVFHQLKGLVPGLSVAVTIDGKTVWAEGFGYADIENHVPCRPESVLRIASITKTITMAAVAKLWENGDLDLDKPVQYYVPEFPEKTWNGRKVTITTRQLIHHCSGIRHYDKRYMQNPKDILKRYFEEGQSIEPSNRQPARKELQPLKTLNPEAYNMEKYKSVIHGLDVFKDDPLVVEPGNWYYSSFGWNLVGAVVERAANMPFQEYLQTILDELGMENTCLEQNDQLINYRGRQYCWMGDQLSNAPYIDMSYKWASEGIVSNVLDLVKFGNAMLYSYGISSCHGNQASSHLSAFLKSETVKEMWSLDKALFIKGRRMCSGMGWMLDLSENRKLESVYHTGFAVGGQSILLILPSQTERFTLDTRLNSQAERQSSSVDQTLQKEFKILGTCINETSQATRHAYYSTKSFPPKVENVPDSQMEHSTFVSSPAVCDCTFSSETEISKHPNQPKGVVVSIITNSRFGNLHLIAFGIAKTFKQVKN